jgi:hypothetical protein
MLLGMNVKVDWSPSGPIGLLMIAGGGLGLLYARSLFSAAKASHTDGATLQGERRKAIGLTALSVVVAIFGVGILLFVR